MAAGPGNRSSTANYGSTAAAVAAYRSAASSSSGVANAAGQGSSMGQQQGQHPSSPQSAPAPAQQPSQQQQQQQQQPGEKPLRYLAMHLVRGAELVKCLQRSFHGVPGTNPYDTAAAATNNTSSSGGSDGEAQAQEVLDELVRVMRQCFQADSDVEAVVSTVRRHYGPMAVYLTGDVCLSVGRSVGRSAVVV